MKCKFKQKISSTQTTFDKFNCNKIQEKKQIITIINNKLKIQEYNKAL